MADEYTTFGNDGVKVQVRDGKLVVQTLDGSEISSAPIKGTSARSRTAITGAAAAVTIANANAKRLSVTLQNVGTTDLWVSNGAAATASIGFKLEAGKSLVDDVSTAAWTCFGASNGSIEVNETSRP